jgi:hypothetical protein
MLFLAGAGVMAAVIVALIFVFRPRTPFTTETLQQASFVVYYPPPQSKMVIDKPTIKYNSQSKVLSFSAHDGSSKLTFTEQAAPDQFTDIPQYLPKLTNFLNTYRSFNTPSGTAYLTRPAELKGGQSALFVGGGTMMFVHPNHDLSDDYWRNLFTHLADK